MMVNVTIVFSCAREQSEKCKEVLAAGFRRDSRRTPPTHGVEDGKYRT